MKIPKKRIRALPLRLRIAWATAIVEEVLALYSDYVVKKYELRKPLDLAWKYVLEGKINEAERERRVRRIGDRIEEADREGYGFQVMAMGPEILEEIQHDGGDNAIAAVENAARAFAVHQLYQQGLSDGDPRVPVAYADSLGEPVYRAALETLKTAESWDDKPPNRRMFNHIRLEMRFDALSKDQMYKSKGTRLRPPVHEVSRSSR